MSRLGKDVALEIAVIGGDRREGAAAAYFLEKGAAVRVYGPPWTPDLDGAVRARSVGEAVEGAQVVVGPVRGIDADNHLYGVPGTPGLWLTEVVLDRLAPGAVFFIGQANGWLRAQAHERGMALLEILERDDFALLNAVPTAEGAVQRAMEESDITLFGNRCLVLGYGRTGQVLARTLAGLGARVTVAAREQSDLARALAMGLHPLEFARLPEGVETADFIFNTVPDLVLTRAVLARTKTDVVIVDIATAPGGTDFAAAESLGRKALLLPGLPGKVAPRSAGRYLGQVVWQVACEMLAVPGLTPR